MQESKSSKLRLSKDKHSAETTYNNGEVSAESSDYRVAHRWGKTEVHHRRPETLGEQHGYHSSHRACASDMVSRPSPPDSSIHLGSAT